MKDGGSIGHAKSLIKQRIVVLKLWLRVRGERKLSITVVSLFQSTTERDSCKLLSQSRCKQSSESFALAEAKCNRDTHKIPKETLASEMNDALQRIKDSGCKVRAWRNPEDDAICSKLGAVSDNEKDMQ